MKKGSKNRVISDVESEESDELTKPSKKKGVKAVVKSTPKKLRKVDVEPEDSEELIDPPKKKGNALVKQTPKKLRKSDEISEPPKKKGNALVKPTPKKSRKTAGTDNIELEESEEVTVPTKKSKAIVKSTTKTPRKPAAKGKGKKNAQEDVSSEPDVSEDLAKTDADDMSENSDTAGPSKKSRRSEDVSEEEKHDDRILEIRTIQTGALKQVIERISQVINDCSIVFLPPDPTDQGTDDDNDFFEDIDVDVENKPNRRKLLAEQEGLELDSEGDDQMEQAPEIKKSKKTSNGKKTKSKPGIKKPRPRGKTNSGGIRIQRVTEDRSVLIKLALYANEFESFRCDEPKITIGVEMQRFNTLLKPINDSEPIVLYMKRDDRSALYIHCGNSNREQREEKDIEIFLMEISNQEVRLPKVKFTNKINLTSDKFHSICKDMNTNTLAVEIRSVDNEIQFQGNSEGGKVTMVYTDPNFRAKKRKDSSQIIQGVYELRNLMYFSKCKKLCETVDIYMKNDYPLVIILSVSTLGKMYIFLTPLAQPNQ